MLRCVRAESSRGPRQLAFYTAFIDDQDCAELIVVTEGTNVWRLPKNSSIDKACHHLSKSLDDEKWHHCYEFELKPALLFTTETAPELYQYRFEEGEANGSGGATNNTAVFVLNRTLSKANVWGKLIECKLELDTRSDASAILLQEISESMRRQACRMSMLEQKVKEGKEAVESANFLIERETKLKDEALRDVVIKFMLFLNSKKREIARLRGERGGESENSEDDNEEEEEGDGHGSDAEESKKQVSKTKTLASFAAAANTAAESKKRKDAEGTKGKGSSSNAAKKKRTNQGGLSSYPSFATSQTFQEAKVVDGSSWDSHIRAPAAAAPAAAPVAAPAAAPAAAPPPKKTKGGGFLFLAPSSDSE